MLVVLRRIDLSEQDLFMIEADAVRGYFHVKEADVADQRLSSLVFTPGADDFHTNLLEQSRCRLDSIKITQNPGVSSLLGDSFHSRFRQATAPTTCVQARRLDSPQQTQRSKRHTVLDVIEHSGR